MKVKVTLPNGRSLFSIRDFAIRYGSHVLIQGESGRGKTTLLHLIAGLFSPDEGHVHIGETRLDTLSDDQRCELRRDRIGVIFQKLNLVDHLTVAENVSLSLTKKFSAKASKQGHDHERIQKAINRVNLSGKEDDRCSYLSLGEQQRVAVARVLAQQPDIILADEPTSSLDEKNSTFVLEALIEAARQKTLIVVSHDHRIKKHFDQVFQFEEIAK
jgi:putative ABC transport system ATP-binding protein